MSSRILIAPALLLAFASVSPAVAHVTLDRSEAPAGAAQKFTLRVPHGCDGKATTSIRVSLPEGALDVKPMPKPGWTLETVTGPYAKSRQLYGAAVTSGVKEIIWSKGELPDAFYDEFAFRMQFDGELAGGTVALPVTQECGSDKAAWSEIAAPGQDAHALKNPAPTIRVLTAQASGGHLHGAPAAAKAGPITIESAWTRATPTGAKIGGGYFTIRNTGKDADKLVGFSTSAAARGELHTMSMTDGVMKMREVQSVEIPAGGSVEFKPGGYHLMMIDLKQPIAEGAPIKGKLKFEKAGEVDVEFAVAPIGANAPAQDHTHH
ncbi:DUF1775 domain-containing protein [Terrarubrum flagellatum]|uniref:DUF1775 domain-containing protein n=1 Tax=Terrirubrum flagellatum TaxID=2895980 RepID=UPI003144EFC7